MATLNRTFSVKSGIDVANTIIVDSNRNISNVANLDANNITANTGVFNGNVNVAGTLVTQNIIPASNVTYNLGSPTARFKDLYLSGSTLDLNGTTLSANNGELRANTFNAEISFVSAGLNVLDQANTARNTANGAYAQANGAYAQANGAYAQANGAYAQANGAFSQANGAYAQANGAYAQANVAGNTVRVSANAGSTLSNKQLNFNNTASIQVTVADSGDGNANITFATTGAAVADAYAQANAAYGQANAAYGQANAAYGEANLKLNLTGGSLTGDLTISGNLVVTGNATTINVSNLSVNDAIILLSANATGDTTDIGFVGHFDRGATATHAGMIRVHSLNEFQIFDNYELEPTNNIIDIANYNYRLGNLRVNAINANSVLILGNAAATQANLTLAHNQANAAYGQANTARGTANDAYAQANAAYGQANTGYGQANAAYGQANAAYAAANTRVLKAGDTMTGQLIIDTAGMGLRVANANITYSLQVNSLNVTTNTVTTSSSGQVVLDKFPITQLASAKYFVQANNSTNYQTTEIVLVQDATNVWLTEYGSIQTGPSLGTFTADISGGDVRLLFTAVNNINTIRSVRYGIIP
jgi:hypothetical protein